MRRKPITALICMVCIACVVCALPAGGPLLGAAAAAAAAAAAPLPAPTPAAAAASVTLAAAAAPAAETLSYAVSTDRVRMSAGNTGSFAIIVPRPEEPYAAVQFWLQLPEGVSIGAVRYSEGGSRTPPTEVDSVGGLYIFSLYSSSNVYADELACTIDILYGGAAEKTITIYKITQGIYTDRHEIKSLVSQENAAAVTVAPYAGENGADGPDEPGGPDGPDGPSDGPGGSGGGRSGSGGLPPAAGLAPSPAPGQPAEEVEDPSEGFAGGPADAMAKPSPKLDTQSGKAYIFGYPDGTFRPEANITRAEAASMLYSLVDDAGKDRFAARAGIFSDAGADMWYAQPVGYLAEAGIILGYPDGTFKGDAEITRAEFATMVSHFGPMDDATGGLPFPDVDRTHWAHGFILSCFSNAWIFGYPDGTFMPDRPIIRAEAVAIANRAIGRDPLDYVGRGTKFPDVSPDAWYYADIAAASN